MLQLTRQEGIMLNPTKCRATAVKKMKTISKS